MKARDIMFICGLFFMALASKLKSRVDSVVAWNIAEVLECLYPILLGAKAIPKREEVVEPEPKRIL